MKKKIIIFALLILSSNLFAQKQDVIDSLKNRLTVTHEDTSSVILLNDIAKLFIYSSPDSTSKYATKALKISNKIQFTMGKAKSYRLIGLAYSGKSDYNNALKYFFLSITEAESAGNDDFKAVIYTSIGIVYRKKSEYDKALKYYLKSLEIIKQGGDSLRISAALNNVGIIYKMTGDYDKALNYYSESLVFSQKNKNLESKANTLGNLGIIYKMKGEFEKSILFLNEALIIFEDFNYKNKIAHVYATLGEVYLLRNQYQESFNSIQIANKIYSDTENKSGRAETYLILGNIYMKQKKYKSAEDAFLLGMDISKEIGYTAFLIDSYLYLSKLDSAKRNYKGSLIYLKKYTQLKDSIFSIEKNNAISEIQKKYDLAEIERENTLLRKNNEINDIKLQRQLTLTNFTWMFSALLFLIVFLVIFYWFREKRINKLLNHKNEEISTQNIILEKNKEKITEQFDELRKYKNHLEKLVDERTIKLHKALKEAKRSNELKTEFLMNLSHEIRTPINAISGFSEIIINEKENFNVEHLTSIQKSMDDLINTIDRLVIFSKLQVGGYKIMSDKIKISDFFKDLERRTSKRREFLNKTDINLEFIIDYRSLPEYFYSDAYILKNALNELIENAFKFTAKGKIIVDAQEIKNKMLCIKVTDTGIGINKDVIPHIFDFLRKFDKEDELYRGMGVGLALVKKSIDILSGTIAINSIPNKGADFIITIPELKTH